VSLFIGDRLLQRQDIDDLGNFVFEAVPAGRYRVEVRLTDVVVTIDPVSVS
jgi:hypothetical protein